MFKNLVFFRLVADHGLNEDKLREALAAAPVRELTGHEVHHIGFEVAFPGADLPVTIGGTNDGIWLFRAGITERVLPAACVNQKVDRDVAAIEREEDGRTVGRAERKQIKDRVLTEMIPKAPQKTNYIPVFVWSLGYLIGVGATSQNQAEDVLSRLRQQLDTLPVHPYQPDASVSVAMTSWAATSPPEGFTAGSKCKLSDLGATISADGFRLDDEQVQYHLREGMQVDELTLEHDEEVTFTLSPDFRFRGLKFANALFGEPEEGADKVSINTATALIEIQAVNRVLLALDEVLILKHGQAGISAE